MTFLFIIVSFLFNYTPTTDIYTLSLHDALPIFDFKNLAEAQAWISQHRRDEIHGVVKRSEEHTSELQSRENLVCRLLLEKNTATRHWTCANSNVIHGTFFSICYCLCRHNLSSAH